MDDSEKRFKKIIGIVGSFLHDSFLFSLLQASIVVFFLIYVIFLFRPSNASIYAKIDKHIGGIDSMKIPSLAISAKSISVQELDSGDLVFSCSNTDKDEKESVYYCFFSNVSIHGESYDQVCIEIRDDPDNLKKKAADFSIEGKMQEIILQGDSSYYCEGLSQDESFCTEHIDLRFSELQMLSFEGCILYEISSSGRRKQLKFDDSHSFLAIKPSASDTINGDGNIDEVITEPGVISIYASDAVNTENTDILPEQNKLISITIPSFKSLRAEKCERISVIGSGEVSFSYSLSPVNFTPQIQDLQLYSRDNELNINWNRKDQVAEIYGKVNKANLSGFDMFPTFSNWFFSNSFFAPLTVVSCVISAVSILYKKRKKEQQQQETE